MLHIFRMKCNSKRFAIWSLAVFCTLLGPAAEFRQQRNPIITLQCIILAVSIADLSPPRLKPTADRAPLWSWFSSWPLRPQRSCDEQTNRGFFFASHLATACTTVNVEDLKPSACRGTAALKPGSPRKTFLLLELRTCTGSAGRLRCEARKQRLSCWFGECAGHGFCSQTMT